MNDTAVAPPADAHAAALEALVTGDRLAHLRVARDDALRVGLDQASHLGQQYAFAPAHQQLDAQMLLELLDAARQRRLGDADALGGLGDRAALGDGQEGAQQGQIHSWRLLTTDVCQPCKNSMLFMQSIHYTYVCSFAMLRRTKPAGWPDPMPVRRQGSGNRQGFNHRAQRGDPDSELPPVHQRMR
jgi:hypothetical protein